MSKVQLKICGIVAVMCLASSSAVYAQAAPPAKSGGVAILKQLHQWRGKLGDDVVQMRLQPKVEDIDSVEGDYLVIGSSRNKGNKILLAGEVTGDVLSMEESEDGIDVSGQWDGKLEGKILRGKWQSDDGKVVKDFVLEMMPAADSSATVVPAKSSKKR
ncbi:hypothetical protein LPB67_06740 [Undibacterium sp. Jales W-56]|uniref:hypothetical protein n=1 Tax=Undibacterium sp. Jales W-56 TaxID=2897325 RepID=UPI0021D3B26C|nr:hypothetical protein [Undibacterium sp. Jales W-56]MCU6433478.1 hypothetical protein [Undibacterium sp. Jales W-56]